MLTKTTDKTLSAVSALKSETRKWVAGLTGSVASFAGSATQVAFS